MVEASLHNEKRQNTEEGEERKGGGGERDRNGNFSNKNVITKANGSLIVGFNYYFFFLHSLPLHSPKKLEFQLGFLWNFLFFFGRESSLSCHHSNKQLVETIGIDIDIIIMIGTIEIWRGFGIEIY